MLAEGWQETGWLKNIDSFDWPATILVKEEEGEMAIFEYACLACGASATEFRSIDKRKKPLPRCPMCNSKMELQVSTPATPVLNAARPMAARKGGYK